MSKYRSRVADQRTAENVEADAALMCTANGCPHRWSVDFGTKLCSAHSSASDPLAWPEITQRLLDAEADAAFRGQAPRKQATHRHFSAADKKAVGQKLRAALRQRGGLDWAHKLREREERGERLNAAQKACWRRALGEAETPAEQDEQHEEASYA